MAKHCVQASPSSLALSSLSFLSERASYRPNRRQILVLYRYTRFSAVGSDGSVEASGSTNEHQLRFTAAAGHGARSLAWAGESLAPLIYPEGCSEKLRELWTALASQVSLPPGAARVKCSSTSQIGRASCRERV